MSDDPFRDPTESAPAPGPDKPPPGPARRFAERAATVAIVLAALAVPILAGLAYYLALNDALVINGDDPQREARLWMIHDRRGPAGLALSVASPIDSPAGAAARCARTQAGFLKWDGGLRLEPPVRYCQCYERAGGQWVASPIDCP